MPNGDDRNFVRLCGAIDGFRVRFGAWPTIARMAQGYIDDLKHILSPAGFEQLESKLRLIPDEGAHFVVEDETGRSYDYSREGFPDREPDHRAEEWLSAERRPPSSEELDLYRQEIERMKREHPDADGWIILP